MHSESVEDCQLCVDIIQEIIEELIANQMKDLSKVFLLNKKWALEHLETL